MQRSKEVIARMPSAGPADVDRAAAAARRDVEPKVIDGIPT
jgi:acyl-CoA reductase-like NAD-dependent aldehyde dehydrogenase